MTGPADHLFIITGGPGSGKTTLIQALAEAGYPTSEEVGRRIIQEQLAIGGMGLPWNDRSLFTELMLSWQMRSYHDAAVSGAITFCDRGVPDVIGYLRVEGMAVPTHVAEAANTLLYAKTVFICPPWPEIFHQDVERRQSHEVAVRTYEAMVRTYDELGYRLVEVPRLSVAERQAFVLESLGVMLRQR